MPSPDVTLTDRLPTGDAAHDPDAAPFMAVADGEPAGIILFRFRRRLNRATYEGWVSDLFVREPFRARGIGRMGGDFP